MPKAKKDNAINPRSSAPNDRRIGELLRSIRMAKGKSQEWLGDKLGVSFQQIQKYEKGVNKIGATRMTEIAAALEEPLSTFMPSKGRVSADLELMFSAIQTKEVQRVIKAFGFLTPDMQRDFTRLVETMAAHCEDSGG